METKEKFERAKRLYKTANADQKYVLESLFPELAESEDERIRKELIAEVKEQIDCIPAKDCRDEEDEKALKQLCKWLAWLEKQCEKGINGNERDFPISKPPLTIKHAKEVMGIKQDDAWSEEDELHIRELESLVKQEWAIAEHGNDKDKIHKMSDLSFFLKTLKPQLKQEWSEDDEVALGDALWCCKQAASIAKNENDMGNVWYAEHWLKSLKNRYTWKPSDEQMGVIAQSVAMLKVSGYGELGDRLGDISEQLNKLR